MEITVAIILVLHIIIPSIEATYEGYVPIYKLFTYQKIILMELFLQKLLTIKSRYRLFSQKALLGARCLTVFRIRPWKRLRQLDFINHWFKGIYQMKVLKFYEVLCKYFSLQTTKSGKKLMKKLKVTAKYSLLDNSEQSHETLTFSELNVPLLIAFNIFHTLFWRFHCWLWTR